jgi:acyl carrier protein
MSDRAPEQITQALLEFVNTGLGLAAGRSVTAEEPFDAAGVDSHAFLRILLFVESEFGFWIPDEDLQDQNTSSISALAHYIAGRSAAA